MNAIGWRCRNRILALWSLLGCVFTFRNTIQRSLQALFIIKSMDSMCVFFPLGLLSHGGISLRENKRNHTTAPSVISLSLNSPSLLSTILFYLTVRGWHTFYVTAHGFHFPFSLQLPTSHWRLHVDFAPFPICLPCVTLFLLFFLLLCSTFSFYLWSPTLSCHCLFYNKSQKLMMKETLAIHKCA